MHDTYTNKEHKTQCFFLMKYICGVYKLPLQLDSYYRSDMLL